MIEEKTINFMEETSKTINEIEKNFAVHLVEQKSLCKDVSNIDKKIDDLIKELKEQNEKNDKRFAKKEELRPIAIIVYGMVGFILVSFLSGIAALIFLR